MRGSVSIFTVAAYKDTTSLITATNNPTMDTPKTMGSTSESTLSNTDITKKSAAASVTAVVLFGLIVTVVALLFIGYYKRKRSALVNLTKPHKGSEENSYASSEHSHQQGSKYSESPEPGYDAIKPTSHMKHTSRTEMMYTVVQKRPKDSILAEVEDDAPPVPPYIMEKEDKETETEATAKGSDEGSPPPVPPQTTEMQLYDIKIAQI